MTNLFAKAMAGIKCQVHSALTPRITHHAPRAFFLLLPFICGLATAPLVQAADGDLKVLPGHVPTITAQLQPTGTLAPDAELNLSIGLPLRNQETLTNLLREIYDPMSANYHRYLTPGQFNEQFGPSPADYQALLNFAKTNGLTVNAAPGSRMVLHAVGKVADVERAFHVKMLTYPHPAEARDFFSPDTEPTVSSQLQVLSVQGLNNYLLPRPALHRAATPGATSGLGSGPGGGYIGQDFRTAYVPGTTLDGSGQMVGLFQFDGYNPADIATYESLAGLPNVPLQNILLDGFNGAAGFNNDEVCLDIEAVIAMAPGVAKVVVFEAGPSGNPNDILSSMAANSQIKQFSASWGYGIDATTEQLYQQLAVQGQTFLNASGDGDAWVGPIKFPSCDDPYITIVGGTTLSTSGPGGNRTSETVWNWGFVGFNAWNPAGYWGSSGGISTSRSIPAWQQGIDMTANQGSTVFRNVPDVALTADNVFVVSSSGQFGAFGGTSCASPLWAGFMALVNQQAYQYGSPSPGFINPVVYAIGTGTSYNSSFNDITTGDNTWSRSTNAFFAVPGYDLCTGWGTPAGTNLINALAPRTGIALIVQTNYLFGGNGNGVIDPDECNSLLVVLANVGLKGATNIDATLTSTTPGVVVTGRFSGYPVMPPGAVATNLVAFQFSTSASFVCGTPVTFSLILKADQGTKTNLITFATGSPGMPLRYDNSVSVPIPDLSSGDSPIQVTNFPGLLLNLTLSLHITHTYDSDLLLQLIAPDGTTNILASNVGGSLHNFGSTCADDQRTVFDGSAVQSIDSGTAPFIGSFTPEQSFSVFVGKTGTNVNGTWHLHVVDQVPIDFGAIECWSLFLTPPTCTDGGGECPGSDLAIGGSVSPEPLILGGNLVYSISITNRGPKAAKGVTLTHLLPPSVVFIGATISQGSISQSGGSVNGNIGNLAVGGVVTANITVLPTLSGTITATASTAAVSDPDPDSSNNSISLTSHVNPPTSDLAVGLTAVPNPVLVGGVLTYTVSATNGGPSTASGVVISNTLSASVAVTSATPSQGTTTIQGNLVIFNLGSLTPGAVATATITVIPSAQGQVTATATIRGSQFDPVTANNVASVTTSVSPSADLAISFLNVPASIVLGSPLTYSVTATNLGPSTASGVFITQSLPTNAVVNFFSSSVGTISQTSNLISCNVGSLSLGGTVTMTVQVTIPTAGTVSSSVNISGALADANPANNSATISTIVAPPFVNIQAAGATLTAESFAPANGSVDPGESVTVSLRLVNQGNLATSNLLARLLPGTGVVAPNSNTVSYATVSPGGLPVSKLFSFTASGTNGGSVVASLQLSGDVSNIVSFTFLLPQVASFANTNVIVIPDSGPATPYPSPITVAGVSGVVGKVTATLSNFNHTYPHDVSVLLVSPTGAKAVLMAHAANFGPAVAGATFTFDDAAAGPLPDSGALGSGTWQPSADAPAPVFTNPAPAGNYATALSVFNSSNPNGVWSLFVIDDAAGDKGGISNGWSLAITTLSPVNQTADLALAAVGSASPVLAGDNLTYTFTVTNNGTNTANNIAFTNALPATVRFVSAAVSQGSYSTNGGVVVASLGSLSVGASAVVTVVVVPTVAGSLSSTATVSASEIDLLPANNSATVATTVNLPVADVAVSMAASAGTVVVGSNLVYTIAVTNNGPGNALSVVVTDALPAGVSYGASSSGSFASGTLTWNVGTLAAGAGAVATLTTHPTAVGTPVNTVSAATASTDSVTPNNSASVSTVVRAAAPKILAMGARLVAEGNSPGDGVVDAGETVSVSLTLTNTGEIDANNLVGTLLNAGGVTAASGAQSYGPLVHNGAAVSRTFSFTASSAASGAVTATLQLSGDVSGTVSFVFALPQTNIFSNTNAIIIPDHGNAAPYPATITVSGVTGLVSKAVVTLNGVTHAFPKDIGVLLVSPTGTKSVVMSGVGGGNSISNLTLTFDDNAVAVLSDTAPILTGAYRPVSYPASRSFPTPAPAGNAVALLSQLNGGDPNGAWSLYVVDGVTGDAGIINNGWSLALTIVIPVNQTANLTLSAAAVQNSVYAGQNATYILSVTNQGPSPATGVTVANILPASAGLGSVTLSQGNYTTNFPTVFCNLGTLNVGQGASATIVVNPTQAGSALDSAQVSANETDLNPGDNFASASISVVAVIPARLTGVVLRTNNYFQLTLTGQPNFNYIIQASTNLTLNPGAWKSISTNIAAANGTFQFMDTNTPGLPQRYYRAMLLP